MPDLFPAPQPLSLAETPQTGSPARNGLAAVEAATPVVESPRTDVPVEVGPRWWVRLAWYAGASLLTSVLIAGGLRLDQADLRAPFEYEGDALLILPMVKSTVERGFGGHWHIDRLGAPTGLDLHDFPVIDHLHFFILWLLSKVVSNVIVLYNLYFLLTFPLTTLTAMLVFRHLRLSLPAAAVGAILYAFLPYHYQRWEGHYFLAAYWMVPLSLLPVFAMCQGRLPFFRREADGSYQIRLKAFGTVGLVVLAAATASAGAYYAFFTCALTAFAGFYAVVRDRTWQPAASSAGVVALVMAFGYLNHLPTFLYQSQYGRNLITDRFPEEADIYGLKITHMVLPIEDHSLWPLRRLKWMYNEPNRPSENENKTASLGVVGAVGLLILLFPIFTTHRPGWPYGPLAALTLFGIVLGMIGGLGSIFNLVVTAQIRAYNRISVFLAFFCFFAVMYTLDRWLSARPRRVRVLYLTYPLALLGWAAAKAGGAVGPRLRARFELCREQQRTALVSAAPMVWCGVLVLGFLDQTPWTWFRSEMMETLDVPARRFWADADFFHKVERTLPPGAWVFYLPYVPYPEHANLYKMNNYAPVRGYLHTDALAWSSGAIKGREADAWQQEVSFKPPEEMLRRIVHRGFDGLVVDKRGFPTVGGSNRAYTLVTEFHAVFAQLVKRSNAKLPEFSHADGQMIFLDLRPYREALRAVSLSEFEAGEKREREWPAVIWLRGFYCPDPTGEDHTQRYGPPDGDLVIVNPSDRTRKFKLTLAFSPLIGGKFAMRLSGLVAEEFNLNRDRREGNDLTRDRKEGNEKQYVMEKQYVVEVPPGRANIRIRCTPPPNFFPADTRKLCYLIKDFKLEELRP